LHIAFVFVIYFSPIVPTHVTGAVVLIFFMITLYLQGRQQEWTSRLDFLWKTQVNYTLQFRCLKPNRWFDRVAHSPWVR